MSTLPELLKKRAKHVTDARTFLDRVQGEGREMTAEERSTYDGFIAEAEKVNTAINDRQRLEALEAHAASPGGRQSEPLPHQVAGRHNYSILKAILEVADGRSVSALTGLEKETHDELTKRRLARGGKRPQGIMIPTDLPIDTRAALAFRNYAEQQGWVERRSFDTAAGPGGIPTILSTTYIEYLRTRMVVREAGARVLTDMVGNFAIPRQSSTNTMYWLAEGGAPTGGQPQVDQVPFTPRTCGAYTDITRRLAEQINTDAEAFVREDLAAIVARGVDYASLNGTGQNNQPLGITQNGLVPIVALGANGAAPSWAMVVNLETAVAKQNADVGSLAYITNAVTRGAMKQTLKVSASTFPVYLWGEGETPVNGYRGLVTNQLPGTFSKGNSGAVLSPLLYGNWEDLVIAFWSGMDLIVDPFTLSTSGALRLVMLQDVDINLRHPESFAKCVDIVTQ